MITNWNWEKEGWYAGRQEGAYENQRIEMYFVGDDPDQQPDTYDQQLGTPIWVDDRPEDDDENLVFG